jgi:hypothetical protein
LSEVSVALRALAPSVALVDGDGRKAVLELVKKAPAGERIAVIFDGEKRHTAYETFRLIRGSIALAAFDDSNLDDGHFPRMLSEQGEDAWHTWDCDFMKSHSDARQLARLSEKLQAASADAIARHGAGAPESLRRQGLQHSGYLDHSGRLIFHGGMEDLSRFHTTLVRGGAPSALSTT